MTAWGAKLRQRSPGRLALWCPACNEAHEITIEGAHAWSWNGDTAAPSVTPSIKVSATRLGISESELDRILAETHVAGELEAVLSKHRFQLICHFFLTQGRLQFLADCSHDWAGLTVDLPDWPPGAL